MGGGTPPVGLAHGKARAREAVRPHTRRQGLARHQICRPQTGPWHVQRAFAAQVNSVTSGRTVPSGPYQWLS